MQGAQVAGWGWLGAQVIPQMLRNAITGLLQECSCPHALLRVLEMDALQIFALKRSLAHLLSAHLLSAQCCARSFFLCKCALASEGGRSLYTLQLAQPGRSVYTLYSAWEVSVYTLYM